MSVTLLLLRQILRDAPIALAIVCCLWAAWSMVPRIVNALVERLCIVRVREQLVVPGSVEEVSMFLANFDNTKDWDPGVKTARRSDGEASLVPGSTTFDLITVFKGAESRMHYTLKSLQPASVLSQMCLIVLEGEGDMTRVLDTISVSKIADRQCAIDYVLDVELKGWRKPFAVLITSDLRQLGKDAMAGLSRACDARFGEKKSASRRRLSRSPSRKAAGAPPFRPPWAEDQPCANCLGTPFSQKWFDAVVSLIFALPQWPSVLELVFNLVATVGLAVLKKLFRVKDEEWPSILNDGYRYPVLPVVLWAAAGAELSRRATVATFLGVWWRATVALAGSLLAVRRLYRWRRWLRDLVGEGHRVVELRMIDDVVSGQLGGEPVEKVLDLGAGSGRMTKHVRERHRLDAVGIDLEASPPLVQKYDGRTIPFSANTFDLTLCLYIFHHFEHQLSVLQECARVSKRILVFEDLVEETQEPVLSRIFFGFHFLAFKQPFHTHLNRSRAEWKQLLARAGFTLEHEFDVPATLAIPYRRVGLLAVRR